MRGTRGGWAVAVLLLSSVVLARGLPHLAHAGEEEKQQVDAKALLADLDLALAFVAHSAKATGEKLSPKATAAKPFCTSLERAETAAETLQKGLAAKDPKAFQGVGPLGEALATLRTTWRKTGVADKGIHEGMEAASDSYATLRRHYGKEALRRKKGGDLPVSIRTVDLSRDWRQIHAELLTILRDSSAPFVAEVP